MKIRKDFSLKIVSLLVAVLFLLNSIAYGIDSPKKSHLRVPSATQMPATERKILAEMYRESRLIWVAKSERYLNLLKRYNALALLLPSGRYLMTQETANNDLSLIRAVTHEDFEILMQREEKLHSTRYKRLMGQLLGNAEIRELYRVVSHYKDANEQPDNIIFNDLIAKAFELLFIIDEGLVYPKTELTDEEREFIKLMRPILEAKDTRDPYKNFSQVFFDAKKRSSLVKRLQENKETKFYRVTNTLPLDNNTPLLRSLLIQCGISEKIVGRQSDEDIEQIAELIEGPLSNNEKTRRLNELLGLSRRNAHQIIKKFGRLYERVTTESKRKADITIRQDIEIPPVLLKMIERIITADFRDLIRGIDYDYSEGRNVYIDLTRVLGAPLQIGDDTIELIKLKGVCFNSDEELQPFKGLFPLYIDFGPHGEVTSQIRPSDKPTGAMTMDTVDNEFTLIEIAYRNNARVSVPIGKALFEKLQFQRRPLGVLILGINRKDEKDLRSVLAELAGEGKYEGDAFTFYLDSAKTKANHTRIISLIRNVGVAYRELHALGIVNHMAHMGNILATRDGAVRIADFEFSKRLENPTVAQEAAYRINDIRSFFTGLERDLNPNLIIALREEFGIDIAGEFLMGYLREYAESGTFRYFTQQAVHDVLASLHKNRDYIDKNPLLVSVKTLIENSRRQGAKDTDILAREEGRTAVARTSAADETGRGSAVKGTWAPIGGKVGEAGGLAEGERALAAPVFYEIIESTFYRVYGNRKLGIVGKVQLPFNVIASRAGMRRFLYQFSYDRGLFVAQERLGGMAPLTVDLFDVRFQTEHERELYPQLQLQIDYFDEDDILVNRLQRLISENTEGSRAEAKLWIDKYVEFIKEMWRRGAFIGDPRFDNFAITKDGELVLLDFNFLEYDLDVEDFDEIVDAFSWNMLKAYMSLLIDREDKSLLPQDAPYKNEIPYHLSGRAKEIMTVYAKAGFTFNRKKFNKFWQKGTPVLMFASDNDREAVEFMLYDIIEGRTKFSTAREILDGLRAQRGIRVAK